MLSTGTVKVMSGQTKDWPPVALVGLVVNDDVTAMVLVDNVVEVIGGAVNVVNVTDDDGGEMEAFAKTK